MNLANWKSYTVVNADAFKAIPTTDEGVTDDDYSRTEWDGVNDGSDEACVYRLAEDWNGHKAGSLFVCGLAVEGHPFYVEINN